MFTSTPRINVGAVGSGESVGSINTILSTTTFEDAIKVGRFAKLDTGSLDNIDASAIPVVAGIVLRSAANALESDGTYDAAYTNIVEFLRDGLATVEVVTGDAPAMFGPVFIHNLADADAGKATTADTLDTEASTAEFIQEVKTDVWLVRHKKGDPK